MMARFVQSVNGGEAGYLSTISIRLQVNEVAHSVKLLGARANLDDSGG